MPWQHLPPPTTKIADYVSQITTEMTAKSGFFAAPTAGIEQLWISTNERAGGLARQPSGRQAPVRRLSPWTARKMRFFQPVGAVYGLRQTLINPRESLPASPTESQLRKLAPLHAVEPPRLPRGCGGSLSIRTKTPEALLASGVTRRANAIGSARARHSKIDLKKQE